MAPQKKKQAAKKAASQSSSAGTKNDSSTQDQTTTEDQNVSTENQTQPNPDQVQNQPGQPITGQDGTDNGGEKRGDAPQNDEQAAQASQEAQDAAKAAEAAQALREESENEQKRDTDFDAPELKDEAQQAVSQQASRFQAEPNGKIIDVGDEVTFEGERFGSQIVVKEDVYRRYYPRGAKRASYELLFRKGTTVAVTTVENMNRQSGGPGVV